MDYASEIPTPITLQELRIVGRFPRFQNIDVLLREKLDDSHNHLAYPLFHTRLPANTHVDLLKNESWEKIKFTDEVQKYIDRKGKYFVAPLGYYTDYNAEFEKPVKVKFNDSFKIFPKKMHFRNYEIVAVDGHYITVKADYFDMNARWVDPGDIRTGTYRFHIADPRITVNEKPSKEPYFNRPIAVSHRWLTTKKPDPNGQQYRELLTLCETLGIHDCQPFLIDYCCLPQQPLTKAEEEFFRKILPVFQKEFINTVVVLNEGSSDYGERAWCMLELMLSAFRDSIINRDSMHDELATAAKKAEGYVKQAGWNDQSMKKFFGAGLSNQSFKSWSKDLVNVAIYNNMIKTRREIEELFKKKLKVTDENDRQLVIDLVQKFCFKRG